jgi:hypothetical protein
MFRFSKQPGLAVGRAWRACWQKRSITVPFKKPKMLCPKKMWELRWFHYGFWFPSTMVTEQVFMPLPQGLSFVISQFSFPKYRYNIFFNIYIYTQIYTYNHTHTHTHYTHIYASILTFSGRVSRKFSLETSNLIGPKEKSLNVLRLKHGNNIADIWPCMTVEWLNEFFCLLARLQHG